MFGRYNSNKFPNQNDASSQANEDNPSFRLFSDINKNIDKIKEILDNPKDLKIRHFVVGENHHSSCLIFLDGLVNKRYIAEDILKNINKSSVKFTNQSSEDMRAILINEVLSSSQVEQSNDLDNVMLALLSGDTLLCLDESETMLIISTQQRQKRSIEEPVSEGVVRGPRDGFIESILTNITLIRQRVRDPNLRFETYKVGRRSKKDLVLAYIDGITNKELVAEAKRRLQSIDIDDAPESGIIEQWIEDNFMSPFPQIQNTERPDKASTSLIQGRIVILLDGTPFALIAPVTLSGLLQSPEDYYERWWAGSFIRPLRYAAAFIALFLPSIYIALVAFHPGMIPSKLAFSIAATREGVPVPAFIEALLMEGTMELLREAGIRLPKPIGQTIGIVGGLVIGEAAVAAGIVSPIMVIVVALTAIASFSMPSYSFGITFRILRFGFMLSAASFGLYGIILAYIAINIHLANLKSFGVPFTAPFAPTFLRDWKDMLIRLPYIMNDRRPALVQPEDPVREDTEGREK